MKFILFTLFFVGSAHAQSQQQQQVQQQTQAQQTEYTEKVCAPGSEHISTQEIFSDESGNQIQTFNIYLTQCSPIPYTCVGGMAWFNVLENTMDSNGRIVLSQQSFKCIQQQQQQQQQQQSPQRY